MYGEPENSKSEFGSQNISGSFSCLAEVVSFWPGSTVTQKWLKPWGIRAKEHKSHHFLGGECFVCLEDSILESSRPHPCRPRGHTVNSVCFKEEAKFWLTWFFLSTAPWFPTYLPLSYHLGQMPAPQELGKHTPRQCDLWLTKAASTVALLPFQCQLVQYFYLSWNGCSLARFISEKCFSGST